MRHEWANPAARGRWRRACALSAAVAAGVVAGSLWPLASLPEAPGSDKLHHLLGYGAIVLPLVAVRPRAAVWAVPAAAALGGAVELVQPFANRFAEWGDAAANAAGAGIGAALGLALHAVAARR